MQHKIGKCLLRFILVYSEDFIYRAYININYASNVSNTIAALHIQCTTG